MVEALQRVAVTGASGLIGSRLCREWTARGVRCYRLVRRPVRSEEEIAWDPAAGRVDAAKLEGLDALIHLAGEGVAGYWTAAKKQRIRDSRVKGTETLAAAVTTLDRPPRVWVSASGIGYYGDRGSDRLTEACSPGDGFLARLCVDWEAASRPAAHRTRLVHTRIGIVVAAEGGALRQMLTPFRLGLGGPLASGTHYMSWISLHDLLRVIEFCVGREAVHGAVNAVAPAPVTNAQWTESLARSLGRPAWFRVPKLALQARFGEFAQELLASQRAEPAALLAEQFQFDDARLERALERALRGTEGSE